MTEIIPYGHQSINQADIEAVVEVLQSKWLTQGPAVEAFEKAVSSYCQVDYAVAVSSATAALHLACLALGVGPGDYVWTSPNTFVASANCALYCGAAIDFVDIDPVTYNMSVEALTEKLKVAEKEGRLPKALIPVHFAGHACDMKAIFELAKQYGFRIIADASHAIGGRYDEEAIGSCRYADMSVFSFHPVKIITTAEGGMVVTRDAGLAEKLKMLRTHGITKNPAHMKTRSEGPWYYEQLHLGMNYRITDIQAALGLSQLPRIDDFIVKRHQHVARYQNGLKALPLILPVEQHSVYSAWHLYVIQCLEHDRKTVFEKLRAANIGVNVHYIPVHLQPYFRNLGFSEGDFPEAEKYYQRAITLPLYPDMTEAQQAYIIDTLTVNLDKRLN